MEELKYPIGIETFSEIIEEGYVYVDKTEWVNTLVSKGKYYFLSRPRRFGKSLLLSTIEAFFEGRRELFDGLVISKYNHSWERHPVFRLNFVNADTSSQEGLKSLIEAHLRKWEKIYGSPETDLELSQRFFGVIQRAVKQTGHKAVVLIDEYDKALVSTIDNQELHDTFRSILKPVYATLKAADCYIRFAMITGVTRFSRLSIFSDINNLKDISLNEEFAAICGITGKEIRETLGVGIRAFANRNNITEEEAFEVLKANYDGYHFCADSPDIYNPFSLLNALDDKKVGSYWFATGTPTFLIKRLRNKSGEVQDFFNRSADGTSLSSLSMSANDITALLFQTGYLTIKSTDKLTGDYILGIPNGEVRRGIFTEMLPVFAGMGNDESHAFIHRLNHEVFSGNPQSMLESLKSFLADIPYDLSKNKPEIYFENNIYIIFRLLGFNINTEYRTSYGRIDIVLTTDDYVYVMELKLNGSANAALAQINDKEYLLPFRKDDRKLFKIGIGFSKRTRNISRWVIVEE
ncbi:MAG: ATP-binding protein [Muribaculaceae bacterium]|nr:ATP-binding protein [Muribaculaceae bacterium]